MQERGVCLPKQAVIQLRLGYPPAKWRNVYKALTVLEFLVKRGSERCVSMARSELTPRLEDLEGFQYVSPEGRDQGVNVRHRQFPSCNDRACPQIQLFAPAFIPVLQISLFNLSMQPKQLVR